VCSSRHLPKPDLPGAAIYPRFHIISCVCTVLHQANLWSLSASTLRVYEVHRARVLYLHGVETLRAAHLLASVSDPWLCCPRFPSYSIERLVLPPFPQGTTPDPCPCVSAWPLPFVRSLTPRSGIPLPSCSTGSGNWLRLYVIWLWHSTHKAEIRSAVCVRNFVPPYRSGLRLKLLS